MPAAAVTGLTAEARIVRRAGLVAVAVGGDAARAGVAARRLLAEGAIGLVSFGVAGGLDPALAPGTLLLPQAILDEGGARWPVDAPWRAQLAAALKMGCVAVSEGDLIGVSSAAGTAAQKAMLHRRTGAVAVDLESHAVACAAAEAKRPFVVLRAVGDPAERSLPSPALVGLDAEGRPALGPVLAAIARNPGQIPALLRVARDTRCALAALRGAVAALDRRLFESS